MSSLRHNLQIANEGFGSSDASRGRHLLSTKRFGPEPFVATGPWVGSSGSLDEPAGRSHMYVPKGSCSRQTVIEQQGGQGPGNQSGRPERSLFAFAAETANR
jgi:hypothetical protein